MQRIDCRFAERVIVPSNGINATDKEVSTSDGQKVKLKFIGTWNNEEGRFNDELDDICLRFWGVPFITMRSIWVSRLGRVSDFWHIVEMVRI